MIERKIIIQSFLLFFLLCQSISGRAQSRLTLQECFDRAINTSTVPQREQIAQEILAAETKVYTSIYIPQMAINGVGSYQSDVVQIPLPIVDAPSKSQYAVTVDLEQVIYDGGAVNAHKGVAKKELTATRYQLKISHLNLQQQISTLYMSIALLSEHEESMALQQESLDAVHKKMVALASEGMALSADIAKIEDEQIHVSQQQIALKYDKKGLLSMLSLLVDSTLQSDCLLQLPRVKLDKRSNNNRPEYKLFEIRKEILDDQIMVVKSESMPKVALFATGGNGLPGLDMLRQNPDWFYRVGAKISIPLTGWSQTKRKKQLIHKKQQIIHADQNDFEMQNRIALAQKESEIEKYKALIESSKILIEKRDQIAQTTQHQLLEGITTSSDYIHDLNQYHAAIKMGSSHQSEYVRAIIEYQILLGNMNQPL